MNMSQIVGLRKSSSSIVSIADFIVIFKTSGTNVRWNGEFYTLFYIWIAWRKWLW